MVRFLPVPIVIGLATLYSSGISIVYEWAKMADFVDYPEDAPDLLYVMRLVSISQAPPTALGRSLTQWMKENPVRFSEKFSDLESKYWSAKRGGVSESGPCQVCAVRGGETVVPEDEGYRLLEELLEGL